MEPEDSLPCTQRLLLLPILSKIKPVRTTKSYLPTMYLNSTVLVYSNLRLGIPSARFSVS
jgi:hypothetical protein